MVDAKISYFGDAAIRLQIGDAIDWQINRRIHQLRKKLLRNCLAGVLDIVPSYTTLLVTFEPSFVEGRCVEDWLRTALNEPVLDESTDTHLVTIPVWYGGVYGPDLANVAAVHHLSAAEVIAIHSTAEYRIFLIGFSPGFAYLGGLSERIATPRLAQPRSSVPAGSVGIAGQQTGIYPQATPGGWQIIGRTNQVMFDPDRSDPCLLQPGDLVRFVPQAGEMP
jgi:inhibitor of KinA